MENIKLDSISNSIKGCNLATLNLKKNSAIYVCGPTVYNTLHIGNYRAYVFNSVLSKLYNLDLYIGLTDISDKIESILTGEEPFKISSYVKNFKQTIRKLHIECVILPVSEDIGKIDLVIDSIGSEQIVESTQQCRLKIGSNTHYALWKKNKLVNFISKYGTGHPGWHVQCVAHVYKLMKSYDDIIHGGGIDLKNTHHKYENMLFSLLGKSIEWIHVNNVTVHKQKMSKSKNNVLDIYAINPVLWRFILLSEDYNCELELNKYTTHQKTREYCNLLSRLYTLQYLSDVVIADTSLIENVKLGLDVYKTGSTLRHIKLDNVDDLMYLFKLNTIYKIIDPVHFIKNSDITHLINQYNKYKTDKTYELCDLYRNKLTESYNILYTGKQLVYLLK